MLYKDIIFVGKRNLWVNPLLKKKKLYQKKRKNLWAFIILIWATQMYLMMGLRLFTTRHLSCHVSMWVHEILHGYWLYWSWMTITFFWRCWILTVGCLSGYSLSFLGWLLFVSCDWGLRLGFFFFFWIVEGGNSCMDSVFPTMKWAFSQSKKGKQKKRRKKPLWLVAPLKVKTFFLGSTFYGFLILWLWCISVTFA